MSQPSPVVPKPEPAPQLTERQQRALAVPESIPRETEAQQLLAVAALPLVAEGTEYLALGLERLIRARGLLRPAFESGISDAIVGNYGRHHAGRPMVPGERLLDELICALAEMGTDDDDGAEAVAGLRRAVADAEAGESALRRHWSERVWACLRQSADEGRVA